MCMVLLGFHLQHLICTSASVGSRESETTSQKRLVLELEEPAGVTGRKDTGKETELDQKD